MVPGTLALRDPGGVWLTYDHAPSGHTVVQETMAWKSDPSWRTQTYYQGARRDLGLHLHICSGSQALSKVSWCPSTV